MQSKEWNEYQKLSVLRSSEIPTYSKFYPQTKFVKLAGVKTGIYNPLLPSLKKIERDSVLCKLADEHCRSTTQFEKSYLNFYFFKLFNTIFYNTIAVFDNVSFYNIKPPKKELYSMVNFQIA